MISPMDDLLKEYIVDLEKRYVKKKDTDENESLPAKFIGEGYLNILPGSLSVLAKTPYAMSQGFTARIIHHLTVSNGIPVGMINLHTSKNEQSEIFLAMVTGMNRRRLRSCLLRPSDFDAIVQNIDGLYEAPLYVSKPVNYSAEYIVDTLREMKSKHSVEVVFLESLNWLDNSADYSDILIRLIQAALELDIAIVAGFDFYKRDTLETIESFLPYKGIIQVADTVSVLRYHGSVENKANMTLEAVHNPGGPLGTYYFNMDWQSFEMEGGHEYPPPNKNSVKYLLEYIRNLYYKKKSGF